MAKKLQFIGFFMQNSNIIAIAHDIKKREQKMAVARSLNEVTELCKTKGWEFHADIEKGVCVGHHFFSIDELDEAKCFILQTEQIELGCKNDIRK